MPTIAEQLTQLASDRDDLVSNLTTKGITGLTGDETFTELVPEVLNIPAGADLSEYFASSTNGGSQYGSSAMAKLIKKLPNNISYTGTDFKYLFYGCSNLTEIPTIDTSSAVNMTSMFQECSLITTIPLINTSNVTNMRQMFSSCRSLTSVPLLNTSSVTDMYAMFSSCRSLTSVPLLNTSNVKTFDMMLSSCNSLTTVPQFDLSSATSLRLMFSNSGNLSNDSLNNILGSLAGATSYTGTKTLGFLGLYPSASTIESLSNYQAFIDAGWTIS